MREDDKLRSEVRRFYDRTAEKGCGCSPEPTGCCGGPAATAPDRLGYDAGEIEELPEGSEMGLGCGNPQAIADLSPGETVLDLGSGGGIDCFLAARRVGTAGRVIGVDMTPEMITRARANAEHGGYANVEFRLGEIEHLPVADSTVDVILSNCVVNLSPDKPRVWREAWRVLKPGGRLAVSDVVALRPLPEILRRDMALHSSCIGGAALVEEIESDLAAAGFTEIRVRLKPESREFIREWAPGTGAEDYIASAEIRAVKPRPEPTA